jgi:putative GTP pyrophosphokinase
MSRKARRKSNSIETLEQEYRTIAPVAERFCDEVSSQINRLLENQQISLGLPIEYRVKKWSSIVDKLERLPIKIASVKDLNDLVGLRLILLFRRDLTKVCELISSTFNVLSQYDTQQRLNEDQFGYSSTHFIIKLPETWLAVPTMAQMGGLKAELQLRTMSQHIWAAASHALQYKQEASVPPPVRRAIHRVSALLETVDLEFERVLEQRDAYRSDIDLLRTEDDLNVDLLETALDSLLPAINKSEYEDYSSLLIELLHFGINSPKKLKDFIHRNLDQAIAADKTRVAEVRQEMTEDDWFDPEDYGPDTAERIKQGVFYTHAGLVRRALASEFGPAFSKYHMKENERESAKPLKIVD